MTLFTEQLSAVRQSQWEAQLDIFRRLSTGALDSTEQLIALNLKASRASLEQAAGTVRHLLEAKDARELFTVGSAAQGQWNQLFDYGRELLGIATGVGSSWSALPQSILPTPLRLMPASTINIPTSPYQAAEQAAIAAADAATVTGEICAAATDIGCAMAEAALDGETPQPEAAPQPDASAAPVAAAVAPLEAAVEQSVDSAPAAEVPPAKATPVAEALSETAPLPAAALHPVAASVPAAAEVELPAVKPVERSAAPVQTRGPEQKAPRASRKK